MLIYYTYKIKENIGNREEISMKLKKKIKLLVLSTLISITKITITIVFLCYDEKKCNLPLENWLYLMIINESIHLLCCILECHKLVIALKSNNFNNISLNESFESNFFNPDYIFNERSNQICSNFFLVKELNKMFLLFL